jgi:hypothetical protein
MIDASVQPGRLTAGAARRVPAAFHRKPLP